MKPLYERMRPKTFAEVVGNDDILKRLDIMRQRGGLGGKVIYLSGQSGSGKTTIARLIAKEVADDYAIVEMDAQRVSIEHLREFDRMCRFRPIGPKGHHCFVLNEFHNCSSRVVSEMQTVLAEEHVQRTSTWVLTTTLSGQQRLFDQKFDAAPFLSRAIQFTLSSRGKELDFAIRVREIAQAEGLDGQPLNAYLDLAKRCDGNMRKMLNEIESGAMLVSANA